NILVRYTNLTHPTALRRKLWKKSQSPLQSHAISCHPQTFARRCAGGVLKEPRGPGHRAQETRHPLRGRQLGIAHARRVGHWLAGAPRRFGNHAVHLLSAKWRDGPRSYFGGAHLRPRAHLRVLAKRGERVCLALVSGQNVWRYSAPGRAATLRVQL